MMPARQVGEMKIIMKILVKGARREQKSPSSNPLRYPKGEEGNTLMVLSRRTGLQNFACCIHATLGRIQRGIAYQNVPCRIRSSSFLFLLLFVLSLSRPKILLIWFDYPLCLFWKRAGSSFRCHCPQPRFPPFFFFFFLSRESGPLALVKILGGAKKDISWDRPDRAHVVVLCTSRVGCLAKRLNWDTYRITPCADLAWPGGPDWR